MKFGKCGHVGFKRWQVMSEDGTDYRVRRLMPSVTDRQKEVKARSVFFE